MAHKQHQDFSRNGQPDPGVYAMPSGYVGPTVIDAEEFEKARRDPKIRKFYEDAEAKYGHLIDAALER